jgi:hypothetical protein
MTAGLAYKKMYEDATREKAPTPPPPDPPETHEEEFSAHTQVSHLKMCVVDPK